MPMKNKTELYNNDYNYIGVLGYGYAYCNSGSASIILCMKQQLRKSTDLRNAKETGTCSMSRPQE